MRSNPLLKILLLFGLLILVISVGYCQNSSTAHKKANKVIYYDTMINCTELVTKRLFGGRKHLYHTSHFYIRYTKTKEGRMNMYKLRYYYPDKCTKFRMFWWTNRLIAPPLPEGVSKWDVVGHLDTDTISQSITIENPE